MRKMLGAVLILLASVYGAYLLLLRRRERRKDILALQSSLLILKRELKERLTPLKECFELLQQREKRENVKAFYQQLVAGMTSLGVKRFSGSIRWFLCFVGYPAVLLGFAGSIFALFKLDQ